MFGESFGDELSENAPCSDKGLILDESQISIL
jgi:hypothetical protein